MQSGAAKKLRILEKREASEELSKYDILFENANDSIFVVDLKSKTIESANKSFCELSGYLKDEISNQSVEKIFPDSTAPVENSGFFEEVSLMRKDGYPRFVSISVKVVTFEGQPLAFCILRDVTDKKQMERDLITKHSELREAYMQLEKANAELKSMQETLVQSGKLAALGELAAGIAHELNQPLTAVKGFAQEIKSVIGSGVTKENVGTALSFVDEVIIGANKMEKIISHLRNFTRKSTEDIQKVNIQEVIEESLLMLDKQFKSRGIEVHCHFAKHLPEVYCNPFQLEQVFINLATNARDAIEGKNKASGESSGRIDITTSITKEGMVEVDFEDNGCGIPDKVKSKIFNPFFTTKEVGKGMGLGLSISYGILERINASILVESSAGKGTKFIIKIPVDYRKH